MRGVFLLCPLLLALAAGPSASRVPGTTIGDDPAVVLAQARALVDQKDFEGAARILQKRLEHSSGDAATHEMLGTVLLQLGRGDEAADYLDRAIRAFETEGKSEKSRALAPLLHRADPLSDRRNAFLRKLCDTLYKAAEDLLEAGHPERALAILARLPPVAPIGKESRKIDDLLAEIRSQFERVDLDEAASKKPATGEWPVCEHESEQYRFECNLEPDIVKRLGTVMDDLHRFYVLVYFDGDAKKAGGQKPLIRIFPDKSQMLEGWQGGSAPEGWWSPGENKVTTYDTRTNGSGSLDWMLITLFHEASHQFMTLISKGGYTPAWLNEGTATFFEGTTAMADGKVLWPGAADGRLRNLVDALKSGTPTARDTIAYEGAGSYGAEYYAFGWGLCYFLQQYEDPKSLEYVYRPLYAEYRTKIVKRGGEPMKLFEEVFLGKASPLGHATFEDFERDWKKWILETVQPLEAGTDSARKLRLQRAERYMAAAGGAKSKSKKDLTEDELLRRALGDIEYVRSKIDRDVEPDCDLLLKQADLLERLKRDAAAAPLLEKVLDLADQGKYEIAEARYAEIEKRLAKIDRKNSALRTAKARTTGLARTAAVLLADYRAKPNLPLRSYTFARLVGGALQDDKDLLASAGELRAQVSAAGLLHGSIHALDFTRLEKPSVSSTPPNRIAVTDDGLLIDCVRSAQFIDGSTTIVGEYEVRLRLAHVGEPEMGSAFGVVIAGNPEDDWIMVGLDERGRVGVWMSELTGKRGESQGSVLKRLTTLYPKPMIDPAAPADIKVHVDLSGKMVITVAGADPLEAQLDVDASVARHVGVFAKNGVVKFHDAVVEIYP